MYAFMFVFLFVCLCMCVQMYLHNIYLSIYISPYVALRQVEELQNVDTQECPVVVSSNIDTMDLSFLLCSSGNLFRLLAILLVYKK